VTINKRAGHGGHLMVMLRLESGEELPFNVDTGAPATVFDKSLETKLGKRLGTTTIKLPQSSKQQSGVYAAPKLFFGNTRLVTGNKILTYDFKPQSSHSTQPQMGFLGMDCLKHYCIQLDFEAGKMRFLDPEHLNITELGKALPFTIKANRAILHQVGLIGENTNWLIDTGCNIDGLIGKSSISGHDSVSLTSDLKKDALNARGVYLPECNWNGETYTNLILAEYVNVLGLRFLGRHLVTLNFPKQTMYLKQTSIGPLDDENAGAAESSRMSAWKFLNRLKEKGQLPYWSKNDNEAIYFNSQSDSDSESVTVDLWTTGNSYTSHFNVIRSSKDNPWKLQKVWRTDQYDKIIEP
jgi:hypothetical protein